VVDAAAARAGARAGHRAPRIGDGLLFCAVVFVAIRLFISLLGVVFIHQSRPEQIQHVISPHTEQPATPGWHNLVDGTNRWDAPWFEKIAEHGYRSDDESAAFFPGYPIVVGFVDRLLPIGVVGAALLVSNSAFFASLLVLYALTSSEFSEAIARRTVILLACFPASFFFLAPYSESLFLLGTLLAFWWARRDRWVLAGAAGFVAAATRNIGIAILPALALEAAGRPRERRHVGLARSMIPLLAPITYAVYWWVRIGEPLHPLLVQSVWGRGIRFPLATLGDGWYLGVMGVGSGTRGLYWTGDFIVVAILLASFGLGWRFLRGPYLLYAGIGVLAPLTFTLPARPLVSVPRYTVVLFPLFWPMANWLKRDRSLVLVLAAFLALFAVLSVTFMNWGFVF
jgi:Mannosyltransferase (PIG-V)